MPVELLNEKDYLSYLEAVDVPGQESIHIARVKFGDGEAKRAYVKFYPRQGRGLFNEVTGHLLAESLGMKVPRKVAILFVPKEAVPSPPSWMETNAEDSYPAWCCEDVASPAIKFFFRLGDVNSSAGAVYALIREELERSKQVPAIVAFDDWVANVDRNVGNLLRLGKGDYVLIDHGQILGGRYWGCRTLQDVDRKFPNILRQLLDTKAATLPFQSQVVMCWQQHAQALHRVRDELEEWWNDMELSEEDIGAVWTFLHARATFENLPQRCGLLL